MQRCGDAEVRRCGGAAMRRRHAQSDARMPRCKDAGMPARIACVCARASYCAIITWDVSRSCERRESSQSIANYYVNVEINKTHRFASSLVINTSSCVRLRRKILWVPSGGESGARTHRELLLIRIAIIINSYVTFGTTFTNCSKSRSPNETEFARSHLAPLLLSTPSGGIIVIVIIVIIVIVSNSKNSNHS